MSTLQLVFLTGIAGLFSWYLITIGRRLFAIPSYKAHIAAYRKNPEKFDWFDKYFLGFRFFNAKLMEWTVNALGDKLISWWYRLSGIMFIIFAIFFILGTITLWVMNFTR